MIEPSRPELRVEDPLLNMQQALTLCREMGLLISMRTLENWTEEGLLVVYQPGPRRQKRMRRSEIIRIVNRRAGE